MAAYRSTLLLLAFLASGAAQAQDMKAAEDFLKGIYATYKAKGKPIALASPKALTILTPDLAKVVRLDEQAVNGEVGFLEADPICDCQDFDIRSVTISVQPDGAGRAKATASFKNLGHATQIGFDLATIGGQWRIADIYDKEMPSLRKALEDEIAEVKAENAKPPH
jgi:Protein of unknown function (DUF3828)